MVPSQTNKALPPTTHAAEAGDLSKGRTGADQRNGGHRTEERHFQVPDTVLFNTDLPLVKSEVCGRRAALRLRLSWVVLQTSRLAVMTMCSSRRLFISVFVAPSRCVTLHSTNAGAQDEKRFTTSDNFHIPVMAAASDTVCLIQCCLTIAAAIIGYAPDGVHVSGIVGDACPEHIWTDVNGPVGTAHWGTFCPPATRLSRRVLLLGCSPPGKSTESRANACTHGAIPAVLGTIVDSDRIPVHRSCDHSSSTQSGISSTCSASTRGGGFPGDDAGCPFSTQTIWCCPWGPAVEPKWRGDLDSHPGRVLGVQGKFNVWDHL